MSETFSSGTVSNIQPTNQNSDVVLDGYYETDLDKDDVK